MPKFGPGTLQFGEVGSEIDSSCLVNSCTIEPEKDVADSTTKLCGTVKPGAVTYTYTLTGNLDVDSEDPDGLFAFCDANAGSEVPFTFTPNTEAETAASGIVVIDPLAFGGEEYGEDMASDFEFDLVGKPTYKYPEPPVPDELMARSMTRRVVNGTAPTGVKPNPDGSYPDPNQTDTSTGGTGGTSSSSTTSTKTKSSSSTSTEKASA